MYFDKGVLIMLNGIAQSIKNIFDTYCLKLSRTIKTFKFFKANIKNGK